MKPLHSFTSAAFAVSLMFAFSPAAEAAPPKIGLEVKSVDMSPKVAKDAKKKKAPAEKDKSKLTITLRNSSKEDMKGVQVKYSFFSRDLGGSEVSILKSGVAPADIPAGKTTTVESEPAETTFTEAYMDKKLGRIKGTGSKIVGYGVQVFIADKLDNEFFSSEAMKKAFMATPR